MRRLVLALVLCALAAAFAGCAGTQKKKAADPKSSGFSSADAKNVHDFMVKYPGVVMSGDVKANLRLYADGAKIVPFLSNIVRPVRASELPERLPGILAAEREAKLQIAFVEPMQVEAKGESASVRVVAKLAWQERGKPRQAVMNCYYGLVRDENRLWKIKEAHAEPVTSGFSLPPKGQPKKPLPKREPRHDKLIIKGEPERKPAQQPAPPAQQPAPPAPQDTDTAPPQDAPQPEKGPQPLF